MKKNELKERKMYLREDQYEFLDLLSYFVQDKGMDKELNLLRKLLLGLNAFNGNKYEDEELSRIVQKLKFIKDKDEKIFNDIIKIIDGCRRELANQKMNQK